jgi:hypothetical protein
MSPHADQSKEAGSSDERMQFSALIDTYRKETVKYLGKLSKQARDDYRNAIEHAASAKSLREGDEGDDSIVQAPTSKEQASFEIQAYLERLERIFRHPKERIRTELIRRFKEEVLYPFFLIDPQYFNEEYVQQRTEEFARNRGMGEVEISNEDIQQELEATRERQRISLDRWVDYLAGDDCKYPSDIKYFAMQGVLAMGTLRDGEVRKRNRNTTSELPQLDSQALSMVLGALEAAYYGKDTASYDPELLRLIEEKESFGDMYAHALKTIEQQAGEKPLEITDGEWVRFRKGSDPAQLVERLNTGNYRHYLCIGDIGSATQYLDKGSIDVYFSNNRNGQPVVPRAALAISNDAGLYEVRGTWDKDENMDPEILRTDILKQRCQDIPNGQDYLQKDACMKRLTAIYDKCFVISKRGATPEYLAPTLSKDELLFLYEIDESIEGFGYDRDPRIAEIREKRSPEEDMKIVLECTEDQIARGPTDIGEHTKVYVGPVQKGLFGAIPDTLEHIYTSFPEGRIRLDSLEIGSMTAEQLEQALEDADIKTSTYSKSMLRNKKQFIDPVNKRHKELKGETETLDLVRFRVRDLGFTSSPATRELLGEFDEEGNLTKEGRIHELGFELCPPETGPYQRLADTNQQLGIWYYIGMQPVAASDGSPSVFYCKRHEDGTWLYCSWAFPDYPWSLGLEFVLRRRKSAA